MSWSLVVSLADDPAQLNWCQPAMP